MDGPTFLEGMGLALRPAPWQQFGLAFLLGSFSVATWSDLKHLSAQREFVEIWLLFVLAMLAFDAYHTHLGHEPALRAGVKWGLIALLSLLSLRRVGVLFRLAPADVAALAAAASLLTPALVVLFYAVAKLIALGVGPLLARGRPVWPFMPVVSLATLAVVGLGWWSSSGRMPEPPPWVSRAPDQKEAHLDLSAGNRCVPFWSAAGLLRLHSVSFTTPAVNETEPRKTSPVEIIADQTAPARGIGR